MINDKTGDIIVAVGIDGYRLATDDEIRNWAKSNKVAIEVKTSNDVIECDKFMKEFTLHDYFYNNCPNNLCLNFNSMGKGNHADKDWYIKNNYVIITMNQLLQNQKQIENKKITGYKCIKAYPGVKLCEIQKCFEGSYQDSYPEYWEPIYEEEYKIGDWVYVEKFIKEDSLGKKNFEINEVFQIFFIENSSCVGIGKWVYKINKTNSISINSIRKATPEEIQNAQSVKSVKISSYECEFKEGYVKFGCADIPNTTVLALKNLMDIARKSGFSFEYSPVNGLRTGSEYVDSKKLDKIIENLK